MLHDEAPVRQIPAADRQQPEPHARHAPPVLLPVLRAAERLDEPRAGAPPLGKQRLGQHLKVFGAVLVREERGHQQGRERPVLHHVRRRLHRRAVQAREPRVAPVGRPARPVLGQHHRRARRLVCRPRRRPPCPHPQVPRRGQRLPARRQPRPCGLEPCVGGGAGGRLQGEEGGVFDLGRGDPQARRHALGQPPRHVAARQGAEERPGPAVRFFFVRGVGSWGGGGMGL